MRVAQICFKNAVKSRNTFFFRNYNVAAHNLNRLTTTTTTTNANKSLYHKNNVKLISNIIVSAKHFSTSDILLKKTVEEDEYFDFEERTRKHIFDKDYYNLDEYDNYDKLVEMSKKPEEKVPPYVSFGIGFALIAGIISFAGWPDTKPIKVGEERPVDPFKDQFFPVALCLRAYSRTIALYQSFAAPAEEVLLPAHDPDYLPPYTLVLEIDDLLIKTEFSTDHGWRVKKRPGAIEFLNYLCQYYEVVLFTSSSAMNAMPYVNTLNKYGTVAHVLFRESTRYEDYHFIKDLRHLNRDLSKVIMIDTDERSYSKTPSNGICLPKWEGNADDRTLMELLKFLEVLATSGLRDLRPTAEFYKGKDVITTFKETQRRMAIAARKEQLLEQEMRANTRGKRSWFTGGSPLHSKEKPEDPQQKIKEMEAQVVAEEKQKKEELKIAKKLQKEKQKEDEGKTSSWW